MKGEMNGQVFQPSNSKIGNLEAKYMVLIAYFGAAVLGLIPGVQYVAWLVPLIIFFVDKENKFIAFHAIQALFLELVVVIIAIIFAIVAAVAVAGATLSAATLSYGGLYAGAGVILAATVITAIAGILVLVLAIISAMKGYKYEIYLAPLVGKCAEKVVFKTH